MAWIELHQAVWTHRKTFELAARLDLDETYAAAHLIRLWSWALDNSPDGSLQMISDRAVAYGAGWKGDAGAFVAALIGAGWLDEDRAIHDWEEYAGKLIERRKVDAERQRLVRAEAKKARALREAALGLVSERPSDVRSTGPDPTQPKSTGPVPPVVPPPDAEVVVTTRAAAAATTTTTTARPRGRRGKRASDRTPAPAVFVPTTAHVALAVDLGIDPARLPFEVAGFLAKNRLWETACPDWDGLFDLWLREAAKRGDTGPPPRSAAPPPRDPPAPTHAGGFLESRQPGRAADALRRMWEPSHDLAMAAP
jgi:hypothetical protein